MIYMFLAEGFEETEALATLDFIRRAGISAVTVAAGDNVEVTGSHSITVKADRLLCEITKEECTGVILPGGMPGTNNLFACDAVKDFTLHSFRLGFPVCAICAAPLILGRLGLLEGRNAICYPGFENELKGARIVDKKAVTDGNVITAKGAGAVCEFALEIITKIKDRATAQKVIAGIYY